MRRASTALATEASNCEVALPTTYSNAPVEIPAAYLCDRFGHDRWPGSGRCKRCGSHRDPARATE